MSNQQPKRPAQVARVVPPQERQVTAAEIRNALQSMVRRLERVEDKVDRLTSMAEASLAEPEAPRAAHPPPLPPTADAVAPTPVADGDEQGSSPELRVIADGAAEAAATGDGAAEAGSMEPEPDAPSLVTGPAGSGAADSPITPPPPPPGPFAPAFDAEERTAEERHSRIADRFAGSSCRAL